jgi:dsRNA-specific ribonuclease
MRPVEQEEEEEEEEEEERQRLHREQVLAREKVARAEQALGYSFRDKGLLLRALTHRSFCHERQQQKQQRQRLRLRHGFSPDYDTVDGDNDALEWLGDAVLQSEVSSWLFSASLLQDSPLDQGSDRLSQLRQRFVSAAACSAFAEQLGLPELMQLGQGQVARGNKIGADCFEAVLGAVHVDSGGASPYAVRCILAKVIPSFGHQRQELMHGGLSFCRDLLRLGKALSRGEGVMTEIEREQARESFLSALKLFLESDRGLRGGLLSVGHPSFLAEFGSEASDYASQVMDGAGGELEAVLRGDDNVHVRHRLPEAPPTLERVAMEVARVPLSERAFLFSSLEQAVHALGPAREDGRVWQPVAEVVAVGRNCLLFSRVERRAIANLAA